MSERWRGGLCYGFLGGEGGRSRLLAFYIFVVAGVSFWRTLYRKSLWTSSYCHRAKIWVIISAGDGYVHFGYFVVAWMSSGSPLRPLSGDVSAIHSYFCFLDANEIFVWLILSESAACSVLCTYCGECRSSRRPFFMPHLLYASTYCRKSRLFPS